HVSCWAEALTPRRSAEEPGALSVVLFTVDNEGTLLEVAGELLRLGCDRQSLRVGDAKGPVRGLIRVAAPPWFVVSRAMDRLDGLRAFVPTPAGQDRVWTELGYAHPLDAALDAPAKGMVLVCSEGPWWRIDDTGWVDVDALVQPAGLPVASIATATDALPPIQVALRLARSGRSDAPSLFVLRPDPNDARGAPKHQLELLVRGLPEAQLEHLLFAVSGDTVLLRARPGREASTEALPGLAFAHVLDMPNLFAPVGLMVEPPLRRDRLRTWLAPDPDVVTWLEPKGAGFSRFSVADSAFRPLTEWVDYVIDGASETLSAWARSATFDFDAFAVGSDVAPAAPGAPTDVAAPKPARPRKRTDSKPLTPREPSDSPRTSTPTFTIEVPTGASEVEAHLAQHEAAFLELDAPADSDERRKAWVALAELYAKAQRPRDAGMAWAHAVWEAPADEVGPLARRWAETAGVRPESVLRLPSPNVEQTRAAVAWLVGASDGDINAPPEWAAFLERFDDDLDVRSLWLGRVAVSRLAGGDALGLARARDRVLSRLQRGLSLERDVPRLMRVTGHMGAGGSGTERAARVGAQLEGLLKAFDETPRKRSPLEAPPHLTRAYVRFEFAWGFARLGTADRAQALRDAALAALDRTQPVHNYLCRAYSARIDQALEGASPETPLPPDVNALLPTLEAFLRYKVDRLRQSSMVLEPQERLDPTALFSRSNANARGEELAALRSISEPSELLKAIEARVSVAADTQLGADERARLLDSLLDFLPHLPESQALPLLQRFVSLAEPLAPKLRALVLEDALRVAGHFGRTPLVKQLVLTLGNLLKELGGEGVAEVGNTLVVGVRSLRRVGLRDEASDLLTRASTVLKGDDEKTLNARLALAAGFSYLGQFALAQPIIEEAQARLARESGMTAVNRLSLTRATARALGNAATEVALPGLLRLAQQLPWITDNFNTNDSFCLSVVKFADALVLGHVGDDLTLNETTRRFLEEDEYLVRRRVHRDVASAEGLS
ncbi:MAG: hypothetical protein JNG84_12575, partial [Archangium sp.]|nr:hypothetical protein [Archangium sp.]